MSIEAKLKQSGIYDEVEKLMSAADVDGWGIEAGGKHPKVVYMAKGKEYAIVVPGTPSDVRSIHNTKADLRRKLMADGLLAKPSKAGRKRKSGLDRYPGGQIKHKERERDIVEVGVQQRIQHKGATRENARHQEWGYPLGELLKQDRISPAQKRAGDEWIMAFTRYWRLKGYQPPNAKVASYAEMIGGGSVGREPDKEDVLRAQRIYMDIDQHIKHACMYEDLRQVYAALHKILVLQTEAKHIKEVEIGYLRLALNSLVRFFRIGG